MTDTQTLSDRVDAGAAWLDANYPDWLDKVSINELDLNNVCHCVLGQLFSVQAANDGVTVYDEPAGYDWAVDNVLTGNQAAELGFDAYYLSAGEDFPALQELWEAKINERLRSK